MNEQIKDDAIKEEIEDLIYVVWQEVGFDFISMAGGEGNYNKAVEAFKADYIKQKIFEEYGDQLYDCISDIVDEAVNSFNG